MNLGPRPRCIPCRDVTSWLNTCRFLCVLIHRSSRPSERELELYRPRDRQVRVRPIRNLGYS